MTFVDVGPALHILARGAPRLESLAVHGLSMDDESLVALATGCVRLRRLHLVGCEYSARGLAEFLRVARKLVRLDLSGTTPWDPTPSHTPWDPTTPLTPPWDLTQVRLDLSGTDAPTDELVAWVVARRDELPVTSLILHGVDHAQEIDAAVAEAIDEIADAMDDSEMEERPVVEYDHTPGFQRVGGRSSLFDAVLGDGRDFGQGAVQPEADPIYDWSDPRAYDQLTWLPGFAIAS
jgi:hypothetical protein